MIFQRSPTALEALRRDLPEIISLDDLQRHEGLRRIVLAADDIANSVTVEL